MRLPSARPPAPTPSCSTPPTGLGSVPRHADGVGIIAHVVLPVSRETAAARSRGRGCTRRPRACPLLLDAAPCLARYLLSRRSLPARLFHPAAAWRPPPSAIRSPSGVHSDLQSGELSRMTTRATWVPDDGVDGCLELGSVDAAPVRGDWLGRRHLRQERAGPSPTKAIIVAVTASPTTIGRSTRVRRVDTFGSPDCMQGAGASASGRERGRSVTLPGCLADQDGIGHRQGRRGDRGAAEPRVSRETRRPSRPRTAPAFRPRAAE